MANETQARPEFFFELGGEQRRLKMSLHSLCHLTSYLKQKLPEGSENVNPWTHYNWSMLSPEDIRELIWALLQTDDYQPTLEEVGKMVDIFDSIKFGGILAQIILEVIKRGTVILEAIGNEAGVEELQKKIAQAIQTVMTKQEQSPKTSTGSSSIASDSSTSG